jgi:hypothetical protein
MKTINDPYYILLRDICNGGLKKSYPFETDEILDFLTEKNVAVLSKGKYIPTPTGIENLEAINELIWYKQMDEVMLA